MFYKGLFLVDRPCEWQISEYDCVPYTLLLYTGTSGMILSQTGVLIERALATFHPDYNATISRFVGFFISTLVLVISSLTYRIILWDDPLDGFVHSCFVPATHSAQRANWFLFISVLLTLFNLIASMAVMYYNKRLEYSIRYKVRERFKKREAIDSTHTICIVSMSQFLTMLIYSMGVLLLRYYQQVIGLQMFFSLIAWIYTVPYSALLFPLILIYRIRATKLFRTKKIQSITSTKQTQIEHINQITSMWNDK
uniref:G_PROTEIN_RECEP_F1_2 domain-containing protein n=1 Tax=Caenorhabditis tropicalis TaxID=1561998 RepID=A0A1I7TAD2_9PELO